MRDILFRGRRVDNGEYICGYYFYDDFYKKAYITVGNYCVKVDAGNSQKRLITAFEVLPKTIEQYSGLLDKNGFCSRGAKMDEERLKTRSKEIMVQTLSGIIDEMRISDFNIDFDDIGRIESVSITYEPFKEDVKPTQGRNVSQQVW